jgi:hypothetical protein
MRHEKKRVDENFYRISKQYTSAGRETYGCPDVFAVLEAAAGSVQNFSGRRMENLMKNLTRMKN